MERIGLENLEYGMDHPLSPFKWVYRIRSGKKSKRANHFGSEKKSKKCQSFQKLVLKLSQRQVRIWSRGGSERRNPDSGSVWTMGQERYRFAHGGGQNMKTQGTGGNPVRIR